MVDLAAVAIKLSAVEAAVNVAIKLSAVEAAVNAAASVVAAMKQRQRCVSGEAACWWWWKR